MQTLQQQRAKFALNRVKEAANQLDTKNKKEYKSYASALPFMIHANGLGQAAAFYRSKGEKDTHFLLYKLLSDWLTGIYDSPSRSDGIYELGEKIRGCFHARR